MVFLLDVSSNPCDAVNNDCILCHHFKEGPLKDNCQQCSSLQVVEVSELQAGDTICTFRNDDNKLVEFTVFAAPGYHYVYIKTPSSTTVQGVLSLLMFLP